MILLAILTLAMANQFNNPKISEMLGIQETQADIPMVEDTELDNTNKQSNRPTGLSVKMPMWRFLQERGKLS